MSLDNFIGMFKNSISKERETKKLALNAVGSILSDEMYSYIGHQQDSWDPLSPTTEKIKGDEGHPLNAPLLRTGDMRKSISFRVSVPNEVTIGAKEKYAIYQEFGVQNFIPARSFVWLAFFRKEMDVNFILMMMMTSFFDNSYIQMIEKKVAHSELTIARPR